MELYQVETNIYKDYILKLKNKSFLEFKKTTPENVNDLINFLNYCFFHRNGFFVEKFNNTNIKTVHSFYNKLKSNVLINERKTVFENISLSEKKLIRFILVNYVKNKSILENNNFQQFTKESFENLIDDLTLFIKFELER